MQAAFTILISLQFLIILLHDLVEIPGWSHTSQLQAVLGKQKNSLSTHASPERWPHSAKPTIFIL